MTFGFNTACINVLILSLRHFFVGLVYNHVVDDNAEGRLNKGEVSVTVDLLVLTSLDQLLLKLKTLFTLLLNKLP